MELREQFPTMADVQQLEQIAGLLRVIALYQHGVYHEDELSHKDRRLSSGSTSRVACKAKPLSPCVGIAASELISYGCMDRPTTERLSRQTLSWIL